METTQNVWAHEMSLSSNTQVHLHAPVLWPTCLFKEDGLLVWFFGMWGWQCLTRTSLASSRSILEISISTVWKGSHITLQRQRRGPPPPWAMAPSHHPRGHMEALVIGIRALRLSMTFLDKTDIQRTDERLVALSLHLYLLYRFTHCRHILKAAKC